MLIVLGKEEPGSHYFFRKLEEFRRAFEKPGFTAQAASCILLQILIPNTRKHFIRYLEINPAVKQQQENCFTERKIKVEICFSTKECPSWLTNFMCKKWVTERKSTRGNTSFTLFRNPLRHARTCQRSD